MLGLALSLRRLRRLMVASVPLLAVLAAGPVRAAMFCNVAGAFVEDSCCCPAAAPPVDDAPTRLEDEDCCRVEAQAFDQAPTELTAEAPSPPLTASPSWDEPVSASAAVRRIPTHAPRPPPGPPLFLAKSALLI